LKHIPAEYNGKYAFFGRISNTRDFVFGGNYDASTDTATGVLISNGSVTLPMWHGNSGVVKRYYSDDSGYDYKTSAAEEIVRINDTATAASNEISGTVRVSFYHVRFADDGGAIKSWNNRIGIYIKP
jgi:hypothetical protein